MIEHVKMFVLPAAFSILPATMHSPEAEALLLAIGLQESRFVHRRQVGGPARGFWQFELGGVRAVMAHERTNADVSLAAAALRYPGSRPEELLEAIEHNDCLAAVLARCLLWTLPAPLSSEHDAAGGWELYLDAWRPGKPHRETWDNCYQRAWALTLGRLSA